MSEDVLIETATRLATAVRMGDGIDPQALRQFRAELTVAALRWRDEGVVERGAAAILVELYPALLGSIGLYAEDAAMEIANLAESLLDEMLIALAK